MAVVLSVVGKYDGKDLDRAQRELNKLRQAAGDTAGPLSRIGDSFKAAGQSMTDFGKKMTTHVTLPLLAVGAGIGKTIQMASDLSETQSKVGQIFGSSAKEIEKFAESAATSLGQSKQQALDAASTFAIFGQAAGLSGDKLVSFSTDLTSLATDMASFNNTSPEEAITAIGAALRGESEPIRRYGVLLDDASMRQEALRMGLIKTTKEALTPQQKTLAATSLIFKQTKTAQGDFERTSDGLANQQRILKAELTNVATEMGATLLPIALRVAQFFSEKVVPAIQKVADWFGGLSDKTKTMILIAGGLLAALGPIITVVGTLATAIGFLISPVGLVIVGIAALVAGFVYAYKKFDGFREVVDKTFKTIKEVAITVLGWLKENWRTIVDVITKPMQILIGFIRRHWDTIKGIFEAAFQVIKGIFDVFAGIFTGDFKRVWEGLKDIIGGAIKGVIGQAKLLIGAIVDAFKDLPGKLVDIGKNIIEGLWDGILSMGTWLKDKITGWAGDVLGWVKSGFGIFSPSRYTVDYGMYLAEGLAVGMDKNTTTVKKSADKMGKATLEAIKKKAEAARKAAQEAFDDLKDRSERALDAVKDNATGIIDFAQTIASSLRSFGSVTGFDVDAYGQAVSEIASIDEQILAQKERITAAMKALDKARAKSSEDSAEMIAAAQQNLNDELDSLSKLQTQREGATAKAEATKVTAGNIIGNMQAKLAQIRQFGQQLQALKDLGLNNTSLQAIISAGPEAGSEIAGALLKEGAAAVGQVNSLESQLANVATSIGDLGAQSQFGMTSGEAAAIVNSTLNVSPGAVVVNIGGDIASGDKAAISAQVQAAVGDALVTVMNKSEESMQEYVAGAFMALGQAATTTKRSNKRKK